MIFVQVGVDLKNLKPRDIVVPVNPRHTWQEWQEIFAAQLATPPYNPNYKKGTEPQPGKAYIKHLSEIKKDNNNLHMIRIQIIIKYVNVCFYIEFLLRH